jgi:glycosyltransferase involved in cell wall biosynthesis
LSIGSFVLIKNEAPWIAAHILNLLPYLDEMVFYDGASTDGTLEIIRAIKSDNVNGSKIKLFTNKDPKNLQGDYVRLFDECMHELSTDLALFIHPDMFITNPEKLTQVSSSDAIALTTSMRSFAGETGGPLFEMKGRLPLWKNIYRLKSPDLGAHYFGAYGSAEEDVYFREITGDQHIHHGHRMDLYPYDVEDSGLEVLHFSDVRPYERRLGRMKACLLNQGYSAEDAEKIALAHPRVTLKDGAEPTHGVRFKLEPAEYPAEFLAARAKYAHLERNTTLVNA